MADPTDAIAEAAVDVLHRLAAVAPERRMDTLALAIKIFIESGNKFSQLSHLWKRIEETVHG